jgi:hypothetical protein
MMTAMKVMVILMLWMKIMNYNDSMAMMLMLNDED